MCLRLSKYRTRATTRRQGEPRPKRISSSKNKRSKLHAHQLHVEERSCRVHEPVAKLCELRVDVVWV